MNEQYGYDVSQVQNEIAQPLKEEGIIEKILKWATFTNVLFYLLIVLLNIGVFITTMVLKPDLIGYAIGFFFLSILGAKIVVVTKHG